MGDITRYALVGPGGEQGDHEYDTENDAIGAALLESEPHAVIAVVYTFDDTDLVWTPDGGDVWPPADGPADLASHYIKGDD